MKNLNIPLRVITEKKTQTKVDLSEAEELILFKKYQQGDENAFLTLIIEHQCVAYYTALKFCNSVSSKEEQENLYQIGLLEIILKLKKYVPSRKYRISTFLSKVVFNALLKYKEKEDKFRKHHHFIKNDQECDSVYATSYLEENIPLSAVVVLLSKILSKDELFVLIQSLQDVSYVQMEEKFGSNNRHRWSKIHNQAMNKIRTNLKLFSGVLHEIK